MTEPERLGDALFRSPPRLTRRALVGLVCLSPFVSRAHAAERIAVTELWAEASEFSERAKQLAGKPVEMRGYMPNLDGLGETNAIGRISILEDTDGDGRMDRKKVFLDHLVMPILRHGASLHWIFGNHDADGGPEMWPILQIPRGTRSALPARP